VGEAEGHAAVRGEGIAPPYPALGATSAGDEHPSLTTEHLFATIIEHMFASLDIRRLLTLIAASAVILALVMSYAAPSSRGASHPRHHAVQAGETLWSIALHAYPSSDPRDAVYRIEQANDLHDAGIVAGQELVLP
jgi:hypothetical protein